MKPIRILIADDYSDNRQLLTEIFDIHGYDYVLARNGNEVLDAVDKYHFDLIFMDIEMPLLNGLDATRAIRKLPPPQCATPVIALSAYPLDFFDESPTASCFDFYLSKPYDLDELLGLIRRFTGVRSKEKI